MINIWFTSDLHLGHTNVIKYSARPFSSIEEMNETLIENWNDKVGKSDIVYFLGDFCLSQDIVQIDRWLGRLKGSIHIIRGNHDKWVKKLAKLRNKNKIAELVEYKEISGGYYFLVLSHYPFLTWNRSHYGSIHLHGHSHSTLDEVNKGTRRYDVGVDANGHNYCPILLEDILQKMEQRIKKE